MISVTVSGMEIAERDLQPLKVSEPIRFSFWGRVMEESAEQL